MLIGHIKHPATYKALTSNLVWSKVFDFLENELPQLPDGEHEISGRELYVAISTLSPKPAKECVFEAHREYIDVHYCIEGGETIAWAPVDTLTPTMQFDTAKDYCLYQSPSKPLTLKLTPGMFAIFLPADAHMPKINDGQNNILKKAVVKIKNSVAE